MAKKKTPVRSTGSKKRSAGSKTSSSKKATPRKGTGSPKASKGGKKTGRKPKLTAATQKRICEYIARGHTNQRAAILGGISETTFYDWTKEGEADLAAGKATAKADFSESVKRAQMDFIDKHLRVIEKAGEEGNWQASMTLLERKFHREFGRRQMIEHGGMEDHPPVSIRLVPRRRKKDDQEGKTGTGEDSG